MVKSKLITYASKRLPEAARIYSVTELELCSLTINMASFSHLLKRVDFNVIVDYLALTHIIKSKAKLVTPKIKRLLELISSHHSICIIWKVKMWFWAILYQDRHMTTVIHMKLFQYHLKCIMFYMRYIIG